MPFTNINFKGEFRSYQKRVLDNSSSFLLDGKINIVAAPGSGKTILGLEIIRKLNSPCIIFSPTTTIRQQWGARFKESFLNSNLNVDDYVSYDLNDIKLITSITYQALYSAMNKIAINEEEESVDYSNIDLFKLILEKNIKTICLDEAHHLQNEWQKALEKFVKALDKDIKIISLTATPPYDANPTEWERYVSLCGEIDEEIFVPELVKEKTLCPHQDYIIFNYPTKDEITAFKNHKINSFEAIYKMQNISFINKINSKIQALYEQNPEYVYSNFKYVISIFIYLNDAGIQINKKLFKSLTNSKTIPNMNLLYAERAYQFLLDDPYLLNEEEKQEILDILKQYSLIYRKKVRLDLSDSLKRSLITSAGKLNSISKIAVTEYSSLKDNLRMLILTDYIKKEEVKKIGTSTKIDNISVVSIFETLRRHMDNVNIGCLSGSLVILPQSLEKTLINQYKLTKEFNIIPLDNTNYGIYNFKGNNKIKVDIISQLFEDGLINILIGTQALLGEGWDSPCINSLIMASYVGSFMLSNQMRGRAIRTYKKDPNKTANIWHLATIEPAYVFENNILDKIYLKINEDKDYIHSYDYHTLSRRFDCFVGPNYETNEIESGIERITFIKPPYDKINFEVINDQMFNKAVNRESITTNWNDTLDVNAKTIIESQVPKDVKIPAFTFENMIILMVLTSLTSSLTAGLINILSAGLKTDLSWIALCCLTILSVLGFKYMSKYILFVCKHISPNKSFISISKAILNTFKDLDLIQDAATLKVDTDKFNLYTTISIKNATLHEQNIFNTAITELLTPIDNPKYLIIKQNTIGRCDYKYSFSCPSVFAKNRDNVKVFKENMKKSIGSMDVKYVYNEDGRELLYKCRKKSYISINANRVKKRQKVTKFE